MSGSRNQHRIHAGFTKAVRSSQITHEAAHDGGGPGSEAEHAALEAEHAGRVAAAGTHHGSTPFGGAVASSNDPEVRFAPEEGATADGEAASENLLVNGGGDDDIDMGEPNSVTVVAANHKTKSESALAHVLVYSHPRWHDNIFRGGGPGRPG